MPLLTRADMLTRIEEIDQHFAAATQWGSWMVEAANERERLVNTLQRNGYNVPHKHLARSNGKPVS